jgi:hypothetical protein
MANLYAHQVDPMSIQRLSFAELRYWNKINKIVVKAVNSG